MTTCRLKLNKEAPVLKEWKSPENLQEREAQAHLHLNFLLYGRVNIPLKKKRKIKEKQKKKHFSIKARVLVAKSCPTLYDPIDCNLPGSSVHRIFQAKIQEWVSIPFSREFSQPRD